MRLWGANLTVIRICAFYDVFLGLCIHPGNQDIQHGNELVMALCQHQLLRARRRLTQASGNSGQFFFCVKTGGLDCVYSG